MDSCHLPKEIVKLVHKLGIIGRFRLFQKAGSGKTCMWFSLVRKLTLILHQWSWYKWGIINVCVLLWHCKNRLFEGTKMIRFCQLFHFLYAATEAVVCIKCLSHISRVSKLLKNIVCGLYLLFCLTTELLKIIQLIIIENNSVNNHWK